MKLTTTRRTHAVAVLALFASFCLSLQLWQSQVLAFSWNGRWRQRLNRSPPMVQHIVLSSSSPSSSPSASAAALSPSATTTTTTQSSEPYQQQQRQTKQLTRIQSMLVKCGMMAFIAGMCASLPLALLPPYLLHKLRLVNHVQKEKLALRAGHVCAKILLMFIPFITVDTIVGQSRQEQLSTNADDGRSDNGNDDDSAYSNDDYYHHPTPTVWVANHSSMLDVFILLAKDDQLRGPKRRPIKIVYWKQLEDNPITKLLFQQCGFIPVQMADNGHGTQNDYDKSSFRTLIKETKRALAEGFDVGILPEGQLNPNPQDGLLPIFSGAYSLARMAGKHVPISFLAHSNIHQVWHPKSSLLETRPTSNRVQMRVYPKAFFFSTKEEFVSTFSAVVGEFATFGRDLPPDELQAWTDSSAWQRIVAAEAEAATEEAEATKSANVETATGMDMDANTQDANITGKEDNVENKRTSKPKDIPAPPANTIALQKEVKTSTG